MQIPSASPITKGFVYETPKGTKRFVGHVFFDDSAVREVNPGFDGREQVNLSFPIRGATDWRVRGATYRGTSGGYLDVHSYGATIGRTRGVDPSILEYGFAASARIRGPELDPKTIDLQRHGENAQVLDVGKVDERGIAWTSKLFANRIFSDDRQIRSEVKDGDTIAVGSVGDFRFEVDVFAPLLTPRGNVVLTPDEQKKILKRLGISVESDFLVKGNKHRLLTYVANVGPGGNDMRLGWQVTGNPPPGVYPVRIMKGKEVLASFNLDWKG